MYFKKRIQMLIEGVPRVNVKPLKLKGKNLRKLQTSGNMQKLIKVVLQPWLCLPTVGQHGTPFERGILLRVCQLILFHGSSFKIALC